MTIYETPKLFGRIPVGRERELLPVSILADASGGLLDRIPGSSLFVSSENKLKLTIPGTSPQYYKNEQINKKGFRNGQSRIPFVVYTIGWKPHLTRGR